MKKYFTALLLFVIPMLSLYGCEKQKESSAEHSRSETQSMSAQQDSSQNQSAPAKQSSSAFSETAEENPPVSASVSENAEDPRFSFADLKNLQFCFSGGAGGWATLMTVDENGNFAGEYTDSDMGDTGDGYPHGTLYQCIFEGQFTVPQKVNDYTYTMQIERIDWEKEADSKEIKDGVLYKYTTPNGLEDAENILLYLPGAPLEQIPGECKNWINPALSGTPGTELPFYVLYNESRQCGFSSYSMTENFEGTLSYIEDAAASLRDSIENDSLTQAEYNEKTLELYGLWDSALNTLWDTLKQTLDADTMEPLTAEQRDWIAQKEAEVEKAGEEYEGGSMQPMIRNNTAAEMTRDRVYELMELYFP